jgi:hypothetical protein
MVLVLRMVSILFVHMGILPCPAAGLLLGTLGLSVIVPENRIALQVRA